MEDEDTVWRPSRTQWTDPDGVLWRRQRRWLSERETRRFLMRASTAVAIEESGTHDLTWLEPTARAAYWNAHAAGHVDNRGTSVPRNQHGVTFHVSVWRDENGRRLVLLSEMC